MKRRTILCLLIIIHLLAGCDLDGPQEECDYGVRLLFHYSNGGSKNRLRDYVTTITDYLYNDQGVLLEATTRTDARLLQRTLSLPAGSYTLVSWGNLEQRTLVKPSAEPGTSFSQMELVQHNPFASTRFDASTIPWQLNAERLHYGQTQFNVSNFGITQQTVFMGHAYLDLTITVVGLQGKPGDSYTFRLDGTHPVYAMQHYRTINAQGYTMHIPRPDEAQTKPHMVPGLRMGRDGDIEGSFISYRLTNQSKPIFSIWQEGRQVVRNVDLKHFFDTMLIEMDTNECQEFHLRITIDGDHIYVQFVSLGDWIDGGSIG